MTSVGGSGVSTKTHYARLGHAAQNLIPRFLQEVLLYYEHPKNIYIRCNTNPQISYRLKSADWTKINEAVNTGSYKNFDIPLIYTILRNLNIYILKPTNGWAYQVDPQSHEKNTGDDLERCRRKRNLIIHRGNTEVSDQELNEYFDVFKNIAGRLQVTLNKKNNEFVSEVEDLRTCCMDEDTERKYLEEIEEWRCRSLEYEDQISQLKEHLLAMGISENQGNENVVFIKALKETTCFEGETVILQCIVSGSKCIAEWLQNDEEILYGRKIRQECLSDIIDDIHVQVYKLVISESTEEDSGTYTIKLGSKTSSCVLSVTERIPSLIKLRKYQEELAEIAVTGQNTIICVGTNAGKTYVAYHIIEDHLIKYPEGKIYKWDASLEGECEPFPSIVQRVTLFFCTPKSLCNHLDEKSKNKIPMDLFTLIVLDECHHVVRRNPFNEIMNYYRRHKFETESSMIPQVLGLTASPGTNRADDGFSAVQHLKCLMANMDVSKLSVVRKYEQELLNYSSTPTKVTSFLMQDSIETRTLLSALESPPLDKRVARYVQWISETKRKTESVMLKDAYVPRLIHICLRHLEDSRFLVFVKTRASAKALAKRLPHCLKATHLTGGTKSKDKAGLHIDEQLEVMGRFREGEHLCIVATSVACEGLDIPQCNLMIRYKFRVDEISSYQMRGRIRDKGGREVILASSEDFERETKNILRQYYMKNAIEQVIELDLTAHIAIAERGIYASEVQGRLLQQRQADSKTIGAFTVNCKFCGKPVADGQFIRNIKRKHTIIFDKTILTRIRREPFKKITKFDTIKKTERVFGNICGHNWGVILVYQQCDFVAISKDKVNFFDKFSKDLVKFKKWPEFPYRIDEVSDEEVQRYLSQ
ncbi:IFIH1 [Mytilus edulis]|uniref:IFIH1 n=1 Tax=Mytilus edulis TaxID=6550 RepID=A0A8S3TJ34_MYTED|nr:IFIH1 [Mytilus edulis]